MSHVVDIVGHNFPREYEPNGAKKVEKGMTKGFAGVMGRRCRF